MQMNMIKYLIISNYIHFVRSLAMSNFKQLNKYCGAPYVNQNIPLANVFIRVICKDIGRIRAHI